MALMPGARMNKDEVNYRMHEKCMTCMHFFYPNSCDMVDGNVSPDAVCNKWEMKPKREPMDGESYMDEYRKEEAKKK